MGNHVIRRYSISVPCTYVAVLQGPVWEVKSVGELRM